MFTIGLREKKIGQREGGKKVVHTLRDKRLWEKHCAKAFLLASCVLLFMKTFILFSILNVAAAAAAAAAADSL